MWPTHGRLCCGLRHYKDVPTPPAFGRSPWGHDGVGSCATQWDMPLLCAASSVRAWTEHIERCWLISAAVLLGVGDDQCKFLGRWRVTASHEEYVRTAARAVCQLQRQVARAAAADNSYKAEIGFKESKSWSFAYARRIMTTPQSTSSLVCDLSGNESSAPPRSPPEPASDATASMEDSIAMADAEFCSVCVCVRACVCVSRNRRYRRLHRMGQMWL